MAALNLATLSVEVQATGVQQAQQQITGLTGAVQQAGNSTGQAIGGFASLGQTIRDNIGQTQLFGTSLNDLGSMFSSAGGMASILTGAVAGATSALMQMATQAIASAIEGLKEFVSNGIELASDLSEIQNVIDVTFGSNANEINEWAKKSADAFGLSELQAKKFSSTMGSILKSMGLTSKETIDMSKKVAELTGDFASFKNLKIEESFDKIRAGLLGETEPLKAVGIIMTEANLSAYALAEGLEQPYNKMSESEKVMVRYNYLLSVTADAQGDFARTSDGYANSQKTLQNTIDSLGVSLGNGLLPALGTFNSMIGDVLKSLEPIMSLLGNLVGGVLQSLFNQFKPIIEAFKLIMAAISPVIEIVNGLLSAVFGMVNGISTAVMSVLSPIVDTMVGWFEGIKEPVTKAMQSIGDALLAIPNGLIDGINFCIEQLNKLPGVAIEPVEKLKTSFSENMDEMKASSEELTDGLKTEVEKLPSTWDECFEQIMALTDEKYDSLKARAKEFNYEMEHLDDEYAEYKSKLMSEEEKRLDSLYEKNGANALELARIKALELAEYEKSIDAEIEAFRKKDEVQRTSSLDRQKALIDEQETKKKNVELDKAIMDAWNETDEIVKSNNKEIIAQYNEMLDLKLKAAKVNVGANDSVGSSGTGRGYYTGTNYATQGWHMVGEQGRELVYFGGGEKVINNSQTEQIMNSGATYNLTINADISRIKDLNDLVDICNNAQVNMRMGTV
ncbi:hypothetical protein QTL86_13280 [Cellulosilyticum sp. ST5]|uniref:hypothetical protein n=1 Tax=Cellulosilyticum sp. ST5 TaxID=3055805 RepID=UPI00397770F8